jgi:hypothetical protein
VSFGAISISVRGVATGRKDPVAYSDIETFGIKDGKLRLKKRGAWLDTFAVPIKGIPNVFALTELYERLSVTPASGSTGIGGNLARGTFV